MSYEFYQFLHIAGMFLATLGLSGLMVRRVYVSDKDGYRVGLTITHGIGLLFLLVAGFGMLAKRGIFGSLPADIYLKLGLWLALGLMPTWVRKAKSVNKLHFIAFFLIVLGAVYIGSYRL